MDQTYRYGRRVDGASRFSAVVGLAGELRPEAPAAWPQRPGALDALLGSASRELPQSEDAFLVRVQAPEGVRGAPVLVFVPGGGFLGGAGSSRWFTAPDFVEEHGVVLVTVTYRVGVLGLLGPGEPDAEDSQRPIRDVLEALRWVHENIASFGGDPGRITLAGDSAGAWISYALACHEEARGLFQRLALVSLPYDPPLSGDGYAKRAAQVAAELADVGGLAEAPIERVLDAQGGLVRSWAGRGMALLPAVGSMVPADLHDYGTSAARLHVDELLLLSTAEEAAAFLLPAPEQAFTDESVAGFLGSHFENPDAVAAWVAAKVPDASPKRRLVEAMTLHQFRLANLELATAAAEQGTPVRVGLLTVGSPVVGGASPHCFTLPFLFGNRAQWQDAPMLAGVSGELFDSVSGQLSGWFGSFVQGREGSSFDPISPERLVFSAAGASLQRPSESDLVALRGLPVG